jgi:hypothetical protein
VSTIGVGLTVKAAEKAPSSIDDPGRSGDPCGEYAGVGLSIIAYFDQDNSSVSTGGRFEIRRSGYSTFSDRSVRVLVTHLRRASTKMSPRGRSKTPDKQYNPAEPVKASSAILFKIAGGSALTDGPNAAALKDGARYGL